MSKQAWIVAGVLTALLGCSLFGLAYWYRGTELDQVAQQLAAARRTATAGEAQVNTLKTTLAAAQSQIAGQRAALDQAGVRIAELQRQTEDVQRSHQTMQDEMRRALESKDVTISDLQGRLTVDILDRIMFDSGEAQVKPEGQEVLRKIGAVLAQYPNRQIHVIGHTDNVPIRASSRGKYASNWELSTARATAAVRFLAEQGGVDPRRLGAVGYGEFHPLADNTAPEGRAKNRRIAVVVLSEEFAGSDAVKPPALMVPPPAPAGTNSTETTNAVPVPAPPAPTP
jgi:chemotaxis protein MotB